VSVVLCAIGSFVIVAIVAGSGRATSPVHHKPCEQSQW